MTSSSQPQSYSGIEQAALPPVSGEPLGNPNIPHLLGFDVVMRHLDASTETVRKFIRSGALKSVRLGNAIKVRENDLAEFIANLPSGQATLKAGRE